MFSQKSFNKSQQLSVLHWRDIKLLIPADALLLSSFLSWSCAYFWLINTVVYKDLCSPLNCVTTSPVATVACVPIGSSGVGLVDWLHRMRVSADKPEFTAFHCNERPWSADEQLPLKVLHYPGARQAELDEDSLGWKISKGLKVSLKRCCFEKSWWHVHDLHFMKASAGSTIYPG